MDDVLVAHAQNGEPVRPEQGYPLRLVIPGWEGPSSVKWLRHIKVVDQPYMTWNESMNHSIPRPDLGGKSRWYNFEMAPKSVMTRPSSGHKLPGTGFYEITGLAWSGLGTVLRSRYPRTAARVGRRRSCRRRCCAWLIPGSRTTGGGTEKRLSSGRAAPMIRVRRNCR
jgi:DMSO/TMAO reductase YedYZ molybdopterin-dependent catalytic subunit